MKNNKKPYVIIFLFFLLILFLSPISGDDWGNYLVGKTGLYHSIGNAIGMYFDWEGRFISRILINILTYHKYLWNILTSILITLTIYYSIKIVKPKNKKTIFILSILIILLMNIYTFSQTITWIAGNITYFYVIPILLGYFYCLIYDEEKTTFKRIVFVLINIIAPMFVEHMALIIITGNVLLLISKYIKTKKIDKELLIYTLISIVSTATMLLSPGSKSRSLIENVEFNKLNILEKMIYNLSNFIYYTFIINYFLLILLSISNYYLIKNNIKNKYLKILLLGIQLIIPIITIFLYLIFNILPNNTFNLINQNNLLIILYWCIYTMILFILLIIDSKKEKDKIVLFLFILGICANLFMLASPTWGYRTSLFTYISLSILSLKIIDKYKEKDNKNKFLLVFTSIVMCFYLFLYINVYRCQTSLEKSIKMQLKNNNDVIEIEKFPAFINCNINPENDYHIKQFKRYYKIPQSKELKLVSNWKYYIIYNK